MPASEKPPSPSGILGRVTAREIRGWATLLERPDEALRVVLRVNGLKVAEAEASEMRPAALSSGQHPTGYCGYSFSVELIAPEARAAGCHLSVSARVGKIGAESELALSPRTMRWAEGEQGSEAISDIFLMHPADSEASDAVARIAAAYAGDQVLRNAHAQRSALSADEVAGHAFVAGCLGPDSAFQLGLRDHFWIAMLSNPARHLRAKLQWLSALGGDRQSALYRNQPESVQALASRLAAISLANVAQLRQVLGRDDPALRKQLDNSQVRRLLATAPGEISDAQADAAIARLRCFDLVGTVEQSVRLFRTLRAMLPGLRNPRPVAASADMGLRGKAFDHVLEPFIHHDRALYREAEEIIDATGGALRGAWKRRKEGNNDGAVAPATPAVSPDPPERAPFTVMTAPQVIASDHGKRTIVVLGVSRGGTSMVSGMLRLSGVFMGQRISNDSHEDRDFHTHDPARLRALVASRNAQHDIWGWKYPHSIEYLGKVQRYLRHPRYIAIFRDTFAVAQAYLRTGNIPIAEGLREAHARYALLTRFVNRCRDPLLVVSYEKAIMQRREFVDGLHAFCGLDVSEEQWLACTDFISPGRYSFIPAP